MRLSGVGNHFKNKKLDDLKVNEKLHAECVRYADNWKEMRGKGFGFFFWGNVGAALGVPLSEITYRILSLACGIGGIGLGIYIWRSLVDKGKTRQVWQQLSLIVLGAALLLASLRPTSRRKGQKC